MPLYNTKQSMQSPIKQAMQGMNSAASTYGRMDKKKPEQKSDPLAPIKGAVAMAEGGYMAHSLYGSVKDKLTGKSEAVSEAAEVGEDFFLRDTEGYELTSGQESPLHEWDGLVHEGGPTPPTEMTPTASNSRANGVQLGANGEQLNPSLLNNPSLSPGTPPQAMDLSSGMPGVSGTTQPNTPASTTPQVTIPESVAPAQAIETAAVPGGEAVATGAGETALATGTEQTMTGVVTGGGEALAAGAGEAALATGATETALATGAAETAMAAAGGEVAAVGAGAAAAEGAAAGSGGGPAGMLAGAAIATIGTLLFS